MPSNISESSALMTVSSVAELLKSSERHVWRLIARGELQTFRHGRITRVTKASVREYVENHLDQMQSSAERRALEVARQETSTVSSANAQQE